MNKFTAPGRVKECTGSVITPENAGLKMVVALCSQSGAYESPFYNMVVKRWSKVRDDYRGWFVTQQNMKLGTLNATAVNSETWIMQAVCMDKKNKLDKKALEDCVKKLVDTAKYERASVHVSDMLFKEVPATKKLLLSMVPEAGLNLYVYKEPVEE